MFREFVRDKAAAEIEEIIDHFGVVRSSFVHKELLKSGYSKNTINRGATLANVISFRKPGVVGTFWRIDHD